MWPFRFMIPAFFFPSCWRVSRLLLRNIMAVFVSWLSLPSSWSSPTTLCQNDFETAHASSLQWAGGCFTTASAPSMTTKLLPPASLQQNEFVLLLPHIRTEHQSAPGRICGICHHLAGIGLRICRTLPAEVAATWSAVTASIGCLTLASRTLADEAIIRQSRLPWQKDL